METNFSTKNQNTNRGRPVQRHLGNDRFIGASNVLRHAAEYLVKRNVTNSSSDLARNEYETYCAIRIIEACHDLLRYTNPDK